MEDIKVVLDADIKGLKNGMDEVQKELAQTAVAAGKLDSTLKRSRAGSNQAANALQNLGRVAQDAQFGFIGISNNLNPLLESFQRLKKESGSSSAALKLLVGSLSGAGGVGLALSLVTAIIGFATSGFGAWTHGLSNNKKALDANAKAAKEASDAYKEIVNSVGKEAASISVIVEQLKNENITRQQRSALIQQLQKDAPAYFATLDKEKSTIDDITRAYNNYAASLYSIIQARAIEKQLDEVVARRIALQAESVKRITQTVSVSGQLVTAQNKVYDSQVKTNRSLNEYQKFASGAVALTESETNELRNLVETEKILTRELARLKPIDVKIGGEKAAKDVEKAAKDVVTVSDVLKKLRHDLEVLNKEGFVFGFDPTPEKISALKTAIKTLFDKFNLSTADKPVVELGVEINELETAQRLKATVANIESRNLAPPIPFPLSVTPPSSISIKKALIPISDELKAFQENTAALFVNLMEGVGAAIASISTGGRGLSSVFEGILGLLGDFLVQAGKAAIAASKIMLAFKTINKNPITGFVAGLAAIVVGTALRSIKLSGFAQGGFVNGPGTSTSDSIPARLSKGEYIINAATVAQYGKAFFDRINGGGSPQNGGFANGGLVTGSIGGGQVITVHVVGHMRNKEIYFANQQATRTMGRNN